MEEQYYDDDHYYDSDSRTKRLKAIMIAMIVVALGLGGSLFYVWKDKNSLVGELELEKKEVLDSLLFQIVSQNIHCSECNQNDPQDRKP